jgi:hypothetical protein
MGEQQGRRALFQVAPKKAVGGHLPVKVNIAHFQVFDKPLGLENTEMSELPLRVNKCAKGPRRMGIQIGSRTHRTHPSTVKLVPRLDDSIVVQGLVKRMGVLGERLLARTRMQQVAEILLHPQDVRCTT